MSLSRHVDSYPFWEVASRWAAERGDEVDLVARAMARGVLREGLRVQSVDARWSKPGTFDLRGAPLVGYVAVEGVLPIFIRSSALAHLRGVVERALVPSAALLGEEFVTKQDFRAWLVQWDMARPSFWYGGASRSDEGFPAA
jgi:hypothetical protein